MPFWPPNPLIPRSAFFFFMRPAYSYHVLTQGILSSYTAVGIFEEWALSMKLFNATVTSPVRNWDATVVLNGGIMPEGRAELLEWALLSPEINAVLAADLTLYHFAVLLFRHQTSTILGKEWNY